MLPLPVEDVVLEGALAVVLPQLAVAEQRGLATRSLAQIWEKKDFKLRHSYLLLKKASSLGGKFAINSLSCPPNGKGIRECDSGCC